MQETEIDALRREIDELKEKIGELTHNQDIDRRKTIEALDRLHAFSCQEIAEIHEYLWPIVYRIFPNMANDHERINEFIKNKGFSGDDKKTS